MCFKTWRKHIGIFRMAVFLILLCLTLALFPGCGENPPSDGTSESDSLECGNMYFSEASKLDLSEITTEGYHVGNFSLLDDRRVIIFCDKETEGQNDVSFICYIYDLKTGALRKLSVEENMEERRYGVFSAHLIDGGNIFITGFSKLYLLDGETYAPIWQDDAPLDVFGCDLSYDGRYLVYAVEGAIFVRDTFLGSASQVLSDSQNPNDIENYTYPAKPVWLPGTLKFSYSVCKYKGFVGGGVYDYEKNIDIYFKEYPGIYLRPIDASRLFYLYPYEDEVRGFGVFDLAAYRALSYGDEACVNACVDKSGGISAVLSFPSADGYSKFKIRIEPSKTVIYETELRRPYFDPYSMVFSSSGDFLLFSSERNETMESCDIFILNLEGRE